MEKKITCPCPHPQCAKQHTTHHSISNRRGNDLGMAFANSRIAHKWVLFSDIHSLIRKSHSGKFSEMPCFFHQSLIVVVDYCPTLFYLFYKVEWWTNWLFNSDG